MAYATPMVAIHGIVALHGVATRAITLYPDHLLGIIGPIITGTQMVYGGTVIALYVLPITTVREAIIQKQMVLRIFQPKLTIRLTPCFAATRPFLLILPSLDGNFAEMHAHLVVTRKYP